MDKSSLKIIGARLRREFATLEQLPFPLQQALAELARREAETTAAQSSDERRPQSESEPAQQRPSTRG
jgi:hypothetical protein